MIEGLKVTVGGSELRDLANARAAHHEERAKTYAEQVESMKAAKVEGMQYSGGDPVSALEKRHAEHTTDARELRFIPDHIDESETYLLRREDLMRLGITNSAY
jgi:hypothetical protein